MLKAAEPVAARESLGAEDGAVDNGERPVRLLLLVLRDDVADGHVAPSWRTVLPAERGTAKMPVPSSLLEPNTSPTSLAVVVGVPDATRMPPDTVIDRSELHVLTPTAEPALVVDVHSKSVQRVPTCMVRQTALAVTRGARNKSATVLDHEIAANRCIARGCN